MSSSPFECMYVLTEEQYKDFMTMKSPSSSTTTTTAKCSICGRVFLNESVLAHHLKSHVNGFKCNICGKVFKNKHSLDKHLTGHALQVKPNNNVSVLDSTPGVVTPSPSPLTKHQQHQQYKQPKNVLKFDSNQWLTLK